VKKQGRRPNSRREAVAQLVSRWPHLAIIVLSVVGLTISFSDGSVDRSLQGIKEAGKLVVVTRNSPTTYYLDREGRAAGFEVELAQAFASSLDVQLEFLVADTISDVLQTMEEGKAHIAAAGLTVTLEREVDFQFSKPYMDVRQIVVCRRGGKNPSSAEDLVDINVWVTRGSSHAEALRSASGEVPALRWEETDEGPESLMARVWEGEIDCTVADDPVFQVTRRHYPELKRAFALTPDEPIAWIVAPDADELAEAIDNWFARSGSAREIESLTAAHFGYFPEFDYVDLMRFRKDIAEVLPTFERDLRTAGRRNDLPWRLLAAMGYQESRWDPDAVSPTGVKGFMMLTRDTAKRVGVPDRTDAKESIWGGARYLNDILSRLPDDIEGDDRLWFALASYNMGLGHIYDARALAEKNGLNKNSWVDVKQILKHLSDENIYPTLRHGYARGYEARRYVEQVRTYWHVLKERR
jgi:peptidoglycan lytic transglycosylase F